MAGVRDSLYQIVLELLNLIKQTWRVEGSPGRSTDHFECIAHSKCLHRTFLLSLLVLTKAYVDVWLQ